MLAIAATDPKQERVGIESYVYEAGAVVKLECMTCNWIRWTVSIPLVLLLGASGLTVFALVGEVRNDASVVILCLYLATWSYVLGLASAILLLGWCLWRWLHMRSAHALRPC